jgi:hypothetical protein
MASLLIPAGGRADYERFMKELERKTLRGRAISHGYQWDETVWFDQYVTIRGQRVLSKASRNVRRVTLIYAPPENAMLGAQAIRFTPMPETYEFDLSEP